MASDYTVPPPPTSQIGHLLTWAFVCLEPTYGFTLQIGHLRVYYGRADNGLDKEFAECMGPEEGTFSGGGPGFVPPISKCGRAFPRMPGLGRRVAGTRVLLVKVQFLVSVL